MAANYHSGKPAWLVLEEAMTPYRANDTAKRYTVDFPFVAYESRSDDPTLKRPT